MKQIEIFDSAVYDCSPELIAEEVNEYIKSYASEVYDVKIQFSEIKNYYSDTKEYPQLNRTIILLIYEPK